MTILRGEYQYLIDAREVEVSDVRRQGRSDSRLCRAGMVDGMQRKGFRANLDAWRQGKATQDDVEDALRDELTADPHVIRSARLLIEAYLQAGHIPAPFAERLMAFERGRDAPPDRMVLRPAPFSGYVPQAPGSAPAAPAESAQPSELRPAAPPAPTLTPAPGSTPARPAAPAPAPAPAPARAPAPEFAPTRTRTPMPAPARAAAPEFAPTRTRTPPPMPASAAAPARAPTPEFAPTRTRTRTLTPAPTPTSPPAPARLHVDALADDGDMLTTPRAAKLLVPGVALLLVLIAAVWLAPGIIDRRRAASIESALMSPDPKVANDAVTQLSSADEDARAAVLGGEGVKAKVRAVFERRARAAFDPTQHLFDYSRAQAILDGAAWLLPDDEPLRQHKLSLEKMRRLELQSLDEAFEKALAAHDLLQDGGPASLMAVRPIIAQLDPGDPLLRDGRVPHAFRDAAAALAKSDPDRADRLVLDGLGIAPGDPSLIDVADRIRREREKDVGRARR
jgi:hypothetical protein